MLFCLTEREAENVAPERPENGEVPPDPPPQPAQRYVFILSFLNPQTASM